MDTFLKLCTVALIAVILCLVLSRFGKEFSLLLTVAACCLVVISALSLISPIYDLYVQLLSVGQFDQNMVSTLLKATGIGLIAEITVAICTDSGNAALGKIIQLVACITLLWISIPMFQALLNLMEELLVSA